jgi:hypothetical protein|nr:hypothetical protein [Candidatus Krumholzibacteria bacterium]
MKNPLIACAACGLLILASVSLTGCSTTPRASIELSATIGRDLGAVHQANRQLALAHFDLLLREVDRFVEEVYRPFIIEETVISLELVEQFEDALAATHPDSLDALDILMIYTEEVSYQIDAFREELRAPLLTQRAAVLESIDQAFLQLQTANAVVTGHLASVVKVHEAQAELLEDVGLQDYRRTVALGLSGLSEELARLLEEVRRGAEPLDTLPDKLSDKLSARIRQLTERDPGDGVLNP